MQDIILDSKAKENTDLISHISQGVKKIEDICNGNAHTVVHLSESDEEGGYWTKISTRAFHKTFFVEAGAKDYFSSFRLAKRRLLKVLKKHKDKFVAARHEHLQFTTPELKRGA